MLDPEEVSDETVSVEEFQKVVNDLLKDVKKVHQVKNKSAGVRARKASIKMEKFMRLWRSWSVDYVKE